VEFFVVAAFFAFLLMYTLLYIIRFSEYFGAFGVVVSGHSDLEGSLLATLLATASA
jgi:hypothetical protein